MGRTLSLVQSNVSSAVSNVNAVKTAPPGYLGSFGIGLWRLFLVPGTYTFTVPFGVYAIRVRVIGAGGNGPKGGGTGGAGGGYAHGVFSVTPGQQITIVVGKGGSRVSDNSQLVVGGTSSFGNLISATGGEPGALAADFENEGGVGIGGDFQARGGRGSKVAPSHISGGGGAAGSQLGDGGHGGDYADGSGNGSAGGGGICNDGGGRDSEGFDCTGGGSPFSPGDFNEYFGGVDLTGDSYESNPINAVLRFPFDGFTGCGGRGNSSDETINGGIGGGGGGADSNVGEGGNGGVGAGGGGGYTIGGAGGLGGGGGAGRYNYGGPGGDGGVILEW